MSEIKEKIKSETKEVCELYDIMMGCLLSNARKGIDKLDTEEAYKAMDIIKDASETKKNIIEAMYKEKILEAMEESGNNLEADAYRKYSPEYLRDMDHSKGIMYYTDTNMGNDLSQDNMRRNYDEPMHEGMRRSKSSTRYYTETDSAYSDAIHNYHDAKNSGDTQMTMKAIEKMTSAISNDFKGIMSGMSQQEKALAKQKLMNMQSMFD